jgi:protoheme IX farnesyltransferase
MEKNQSNSIDLRYAALAASIMTFLVIVMGGVVRATGAGETCPDWPTCYGSWLPVLQGGALTDGIHRLLTVLLGPTLLWAAYKAWRGYRRLPQISLPIYAATVLLGLQAVIGASLVVPNPFARQVISAAHLGISLIIEALLLLSTVFAFYLERTKAAGGYRLSGISNQPSNSYYRPSFIGNLKSAIANSSFARLTFYTMGAVFILLVTGAVVSAAGASTACPAWPLCSPDNFLPQSLSAWLNVIHRLAVVFSAVLVGWQVVHAWRSQRTQVPILVASTAATVLFFAQALLGWYRVVHSFPPYMIALHEATASAVWAALVVQTTAVWKANRNSIEEAAEEATARDRVGMAKDLLMLTKPVVVLLLLVTTYTGMVIGARAFPSLSLAFWTLLGGAMAAGGSGAINQYIDRFDDGKMQRTERRPIPSGRLTPGEGLAFGVGLCLTSFFLLVAFVNLLAALLSLAGMIYYVLVYSIFLKKATIQNIVIGGGAGAIPPLVGWAAATGSLNIPSLFLFAVIFMWTPPHFWALAIVRRKDYARAGVPMLPVVRGEGEARSQILLYTIELVALTLLLPLFGLGSAIYLVSAAALGGGLLYYAWRVWRKGGNKVAWMMYRFSSLYLAFLFVALMLDRLIIK